MRQNQEHNVSLSMAYHLCDMRPTAGKPTYYELAVAACEAATPPAPPPGTHMIRLLNWQV